MDEPTISRTEPGFEDWSPHAYSGGVFKLASPDLPYEIAKREEAVVMTRSLTVAGHLVERGFRLRMSDGRGGSLSMVKPDALKVVW